jgi:uncharacterized protein YhaN
METERDRLKGLVQYLTVRQDRKKLAELLEQEIRVLSECKQSLVAAAQTLEVSVDLVFDFGDAACFNYLYEERAIIKRYDDVCRRVQTLESQIAEADHALRSLQKYAEKRTPVTVVEDSNAS